MSSLPNPASLPATLKEWRNSGWEPKGTYPRDIWTPLEQFFLEKGLTLFKRSIHEAMALTTLPPNNSPRCPDGFAYRTIHSETRPVGYFDVVKAIHCPARTTDHRDVLIRLVAKGNEGRNHLTALRRLATGLVASRGENHIVPVLREITLDDMVFAVFPLMSEGFDHPWFYNFGEVIKAVDQVLEGISFCHERLVAHLDLDVDNILINFIGGPCQILGYSAPRDPSPFREYFPVRYYLNDFELAACFEPDSDPSTRVVRGLPIKVIQGKYGRETAPEMLLEQPYCPFRADVWQLGRMFARCFGHLGAPWTSLTKLFIDMSSEDPLSRPTASQALEHVRQFQSTQSPQSLASRVPRPPVPPEPTVTEETKLEPADDPGAPGAPTAGIAPEKAMSVSG